MSERNEVLLYNRYQSACCLLVALDILAGVHVVIEVP